MLIALYIVLGLIVLFGIIVALQPADFKFTRSTVINAPPSTVFPLVNDFTNWKNWSPWLKLDPNVVVTLTGPTSGVGAKYEWVGNNKIGAGKMEILESRQDDLVKIDLQFLKPFAAHNTALYEFRPVNGGTELSWSMIGKRNFMFKAMGLLMNMDKMIGKDFEEGLAKIKALAENAER